jgi:hypothetical protein
MKVFLFDDDPKKHKALDGLLNMANISLANRIAGISLVSGFNQLPDRRAPLANPQLLWETLNLPESLYLIDLNLIDQDDLAITASARVFQDLVKPEQVRNEFERFWATIPHDLLKKNFELALKLICACRAVRRPFMMVTTEGSQGTVAALKRCRLIEDSSMIPEIGPEDPNDEEARKFAEALVRLIDPVRALRAKTAQWFSTHDPDDWSTCPTHGFPEDGQDGRLACAALAVLARTVFPWFPEGAFSNLESAKAFHGILKTFCGDAALWSGGNHPLSLGGAYLLLLYAIQFRHSEYLKANRDVFLVDFKAFVDRDGDLLPFLPHQPRGFAEVTFRALFNVFVEVATVKETTRCAIRSIVFDPQSGCVEAVLLWDPVQRKKLSDTSLATLLEGMNHDGHFHLQASRTSGLLLRFVLASQVRENGFGATGRVIMENNGLFKLCP